jgi:hypothetical protein
MKKLCFLLLVLCLVGKVQGQDQPHYQFVYVNGKITEGKTELVAGKYYASDAKVKLEGKVAILYDTSSKKLVTIRSTEKDEVKNLIEPIEVAGIKCCGSSYTFFVAYANRPYPLLYDDTVLDFGHMDIPNQHYESKLIYSYINSITQMKYTKLFGKEKYTYGFPLGKLVTENNIDTLAFYVAETGDVKQRKLIAKRAIKQIDSQALRTRIAPLVEIMKKHCHELRKEDKELMQDIFSEFIYEMCGYPDEKYLRKWILENFKLDISW